MLASDQAKAFAAAVTLNVTAAAASAGLGEMLMDVPTVVQLGNLAVSIGANVADWIPALSTL